MSTVYCVREAHSNCVDVTNRKTSFLEDGCLETVMYFAINGVWNLWLQSISRPVGWVSSFLVRYRFIMTSFYSCNYGPSFTGTRTFHGSLPSQAVPARRAEGGWSRYILPGPDNVADVFMFLGSIIICRLYKLNLTYQAQVTLQLRVNVFDSVMWYKVGPHLWGAQKLFFTGARTRSRRSFSQVL
jgi:hypothetical protein